jgi:hypothetical protein
MSSKPPPWRATCEADKAAMIAFVTDKLDELNAENDAKGEHPSFVRWDGSVSPRVVLQQAKKEVRKGNPKPLAELLAALAGDPEIAGFDIIPPRQRYEHRPPRKRKLSRVECAIRAVASIAAEDVIRIRTIIWPKHYGRSRRHASDGPAAESRASCSEAVLADRIMFNIKGNDYRLVGAVDFEKGIVWIK